ncbi:MAG: type II and III secretion system protein family protein [Hyphomicrobiales bacterium]|nr:type II and III secretion system protein family protein [Hyphomicrobiales bacterium]
MRRFAKRIAIGGVLAALALTAPAGGVSAQPVGVEPASAAMFAKRISLGVGRTIILDLPADASEIVVGDPKVANAIVRSTRKLYIMGLASGQTTILALDHAGRQIANIEMNIGRDLDQLDKLLKAALPRTKIVAKQVSDSVVLTGEASSSGEAATALDIAKAYVSRVSGAAPGAAAGGAGGDGAVVNAITIRSQEQVMVKLTIAEVQRTILKQLGVSTSSTGDTILKTTWATLTQQNAFGLNGQLGNSGLTIPLGNSLSATLSAFERYGVSRTLAEPTVTAVSGEAAKFTVGGELPVPANSACSTSLGVTTCQNTVTFKPYGVTLNMTPVVIGEGRILLRIATEVTEVDTTQTVTINSISVPGFRTRKHETTVELPSGGSIATAGLITNNSKHSITGLPGLLNLPILGALFRSRDYQRQETELMIIVTPYIAHSVSPGDVSRPDDGFADATDMQGVLLGRVNRLYSSRSNPQAVQNWKGRFGFIQD